MTATPCAPSSKPSAPRSSFPRTGHARGLSATTRRSTESATRSSDASTGSSTSGASPPAMIAGQYASWPSSTSHAQCSGGHECRFVLGLRRGLQALYDDDLGEVHARDEGVERFGAGIKQEVAVDELAHIAFEGRAAGAGFACDGVDFDDRFLALPFVADGVDGAVVEVDRVDLHLLFDDAVGFDLADGL